MGARPANAMLALKHGKSLAESVADVKYFVLQSKTKIDPVTDLGKLLILLGGMLLLAGLGMVLAGRAGLPLGRLPGDFVYRGKNTTFYFPLATSIVVSVVLSVLMYVVGRIRR
jgi:hypothetical protein